MISTVRGSFNDVTGDVRVDVDDLDVLTGHGGDDGLVGQLVGDDGISTGQQVDGGDGHQ